MYTKFTKFKNTATEAYSEPCQASRVKFFTKKSPSIALTISRKNSILDV